jgi:hypothetical protein
MRLLLSTYDSRGGVEPLVGLAVRLRALGAKVRVCVPSDCAERLVEVGVPLVGRAQDCPGPDTRGRATAMGRHRPHRRGDRSRDAAARSELMTWTP